MALNLGFTTWQDGDTPGASDLNRLQENDRYFSEPPFVRATRVFDLNVPNNTVTAVGFNSEYEDQSGLHDITADVSHRFLLGNIPGFYLITASVQWSAPTGQPDGVRQIRLVKQPGDSVIARDDRGPVFTAGLGTTQSITTVMPFGSGTYVEVHVYHTQGATLQIETAGAYNPLFSALWVSR